MSNYLIVNVLDTAQYTAGVVRVAQRALHRPAAARCAALRLLQHGGRWSVVMNICAQAGLTVGL